MTLLEKRDAFKAKTTKIWQEDFFTTEEKCQFTADIFCQIFNLPGVEVILVPGEEFPVLSTGVRATGMYADGRIWVNGDSSKFVGILLHELRHHWQIVICQDFYLRDLTNNDYEERRIEKDAYTFQFKFWSAKTLEELEDICAFDSIKIAA